MLLWNHLYLTVQYGCWRERAELLIWAGEGYRHQSGALLLSVLVPNGPSRVHFGHNSRLLSFNSLILTRPEIPPAPPAAQPDEVRLILGTLFTTDASWELHATGHGAPSLPGDAGSPQSSQSGRTSGTCYREHQAHPVMSSVTAASQKLGRH